MASQQQPPADCMRVLLEVSPGSDRNLPHPCFKSDGQRFQAADTTVKLAKDGVYKLNIVCSPPSTIEHAELASTTDLQQPLSLELQSSCEEAAGVSTHTCTWTCSLEVSKKNQRHVLELSLSIETFGTLVLPLQVKVYPSYDKALLHGNRLRHLQYLYKNKSDEMVLISTAAFSL